MLVVLLIKCCKVEYNYMVNIVLGLNLCLSKMCINNKKELVSKGK